MKRRVAVGLILTMLLSVFIPLNLAWAAIETDDVDMSASGAVAIDANTGEVLYDRNMDEQAYPASTTKIMTALVVLENMELDDVVTVGPDATHIEGSTLDLQEGEELTVIDLLYGMMLKSTNDSAIALAEACAGSTEAFAGLMNAKAAEIGAVNTHFVTPNGLTDEDHYTTPHDLALIMQAALKNDVLREIMGTSKYTMAATWYSEAREVENSNRLLSDDSPLEMDGEERTYRYDGIEAGKTGYTSASQYCLVEYAVRDGLEVIAVTMHSSFEEQYPDAIRLLDAVFDRYEGLRILKEGTLIDKVYVKNGGKADVTIDKPIVACVEKGSDVSTSDYSWRIEPDEGLVAPLPAGSKAGKLILTRNAEDVAVYDIYTASDTDESAFRKLVDGFKGSILSKLLVVLLLFVVALIIAGVLMMRPSKKRAAKRKQRRAENAGEEDARIARRAAERDARRAEARERRKQEEQKRAAALEEQVRAEERRKKEEAEQALQAIKEAEADADAAAKAESAAAADKLPEAAAGKALEAAAEKAAESVADKAVQTVQEAAAGVEQAASVPGASDEGNR